MKTPFFYVLMSTALLAPSAFAAEPAPTSTQLLHIRTLAASCAACHGTLGNAVGDNKPTETVSLAGLERAQISQRLHQYRSGERTSTVMHRHAKGLSEEEIEQLAAYFSQQTIVKRDAPVSQKLKEIAHE